MTEKTVLFYTIVIALVYMAFAMLSPFLLAILWAVVFSIVLFPVYEVVLVKVSNANVASILIVVISFLLFVVPLLYFTYLLTDEIKGIMGQSDGKNIPAIFIENKNLKSALEIIGGLLYIQPNELYDEFIKFIGSVKSGLTHIVRENALVAINVIVNYFIMLFTLFFLLRDHKRFVSAIKRLLPLSATQKDGLMERIREVVVSTMYGGVMIALMTGIIGGVAFNFLGVPSPLLLGFAMAVFSFIPVVGSFAVWGPVMAYLFIKGAIIKSLIVAFIGVVVIVVLVEHILKPKIIGGRAKIHTVLIFFGVLGGIHLFGVIGFVVGPLIIAVLIMASPLIEQKLAR